MLDLKPFQDLINEDANHPTACLPKDTLYKLVEEIQFLRSLTKGCCCSDGVVQDIINVPKQNENNPFPEFGGVICHKCNGLNVLVNLNIHQRKRIIALEEELEQAREEREKVAALLVKK